MKPRKLNLSEIWQLYLLLKPAMAGRELNGLLIDEILSLLELSPEGTLVACLNILYNKVELDRLNPLELGLAFIIGLKENKFFEFVDFIRITSDDISR
jgi:hypothetical protein